MGREMREYLEIVEDRLVDLDTIQKRLLFIITPFFVTGAFFYFFIDSQLSTLEEKKQKIVTLDKQIQKDSPRMYSSKIVAIRKHIKQNKTLIDDEKMKELALERKLSAMRFLFSDEKDFNIFLETLLAKSLYYDFTIATLSIENKEQNYIGMLDIKKNIHLKGQGDFINTLSFIRAIEDNKMLISIKNFSVETNGSLPQTDVVIEFYGVKQ